MIVQPIHELRKASIAGLLEKICQALDLTDTQRLIAAERYGAIADWLSEADDVVLRDLTIYPQGSMALGTSVKPTGQNEYDVDLVSFSPGLTRDFPPARLKRIIGDRLRANGRYADILEEKPRCWRINYANEFHLERLTEPGSGACSTGMHEQATGTGCAVGDDRATAAGGTAKAKGWATPGV